MRIYHTLFVISFLLLCTGVSTLRAEEQNLDEISRQLDNPLTSLWSLTFEDKVYVKEGDAIEGSTMAIRFSSSLAYLFQSAGTRTRFLSFARFFLWSLTRFLIQPNRMV